MDPRAALSGTREGPPAHSGLDPIRTAPRLEAIDLWMAPPGVSESPIRGMSLEIAAGERVALTGPNGSGKTCLALGIAGLWPTRRGVVRVDGDPLDPTAVGRARARIAVVLQEPSSQLFERTVAEEIAFTAMNLGDSPAAAAAKARRWAERLGLDGEMDRAPQSLSAGRQQLVLLAAALATEPVLLVADEAAAHLDPVARHRVVTVVEQEASKGLAILWVTQDVRDLEWADRVVALDSAAAGGPSHVQRNGPPLIRGEGDRRVDPDGPLVRVSPPEGDHGPRVLTAEELTFRIGPAKPVALTGPNGSGKSVVLEAIAGALPMRQVRVEGPWAMSPILAGQYPELQIFAESVEEELLFSSIERGRTKRESLEAAIDLLDRLGLDRNALRRSPWDLSSGERRVMQLIACLVAPADAYLVDEPTCGLDPNRSSAVATILRERSAHSAIVVATQDRDLVSVLDGQEVELGVSPRFGKSQPKNGLTGECSGT